MTDLRAWKNRLEGFTREVKTILGDSEGSYTSRTFNAHESLEKVDKLTFLQADSFKQSVRCVEAGLYRAAFVMAWTSIADLLLLLGEAKEQEIKVIRPKWKFTDKHSLAEQQGDFAVILALKETKSISKADMKSLHGLLHRRNQCAHPSNFFPTANEALGYVDEAITSADALVTKLTVS